MFDRCTKPNAHTKAPLGCGEQLWRQDRPRPPAANFRNHQRLLKEPRKAHANPEPPGLFGNLPGKAGK
jgi:hypothetical protein